MAMGWCSENSRQLWPLLHLLLPLCVSLIAEEMIVSVLVDVTTNSLCLGRRICPLAIYIAVLPRTVVGIFKMSVFPLLGQLADDYWSKPLLILIVSTNIIPFTLLAVDQSKGSVYAYYVLWYISDIIRQGSIFCISVSSEADVVDDSNSRFSASQVIRNLLAHFPQNNDIFELADDSNMDDSVNMDDSAMDDSVMDAREFLAAFCWISVLFSQVIGNVLARSLPKDYIFEVSIALLVIVSVYMALFLTKTYYLKSAFGFNKNQFSEILIGVRVGSFFSKILVLHFLNDPLVGAKAAKPILCAALLASIACGLLYGLAWASWVPYLSALFGLIYVLVKPSTRSFISKASNSRDDQRKAQEFVVGVQSIASILSPLAMTPLTIWFLSSNAPFDCKGFSIIFASISMVISLCFAWTLKLDASSNMVSEDTDNNEQPPEDNIEQPLLS